MGREALRRNGEDPQEPRIRPRLGREPRTRGERAMTTIGVGRPRPNDQRAFIHKKLLGIGAKLAGVLPIPAGGLISTGLRFLGGGGGTVRIGRPAARPTRPRTSTARPSSFSESEKRAGGFAKFGPEAGLAARPASLTAGGGGPCADPRLIMAPDGHCVAVGSGHHAQHFGGDGGGPTGETVMGRYGAGVVPGSMVIDRAVCGKSMRLGDDGICYNKTQISNKQRMWPRGRRPLLTGGDMRAISIAARSGRRLDDTAGKLRGMGLMKPLPKPRKAKAHAHAVPARAVSVS